MKIVVISDVHANLAALEALPEEQYDILWCLGDLVNYGPMPHEVVQWVKTKAALVVRGNHDHAVGFNVDPQCSPPFKKLAAVTGLFFQQVCTVEDTHFLRSLPIHYETVVDSSKFYLVHAMPSDPLFGYCPEDSPLWQTEAKQCDADVLLVGHTHTPFIRRFGHTLVVNPGSLGQPKTGRPLACYAVIQQRRYVVVPGADDEGDLILLLKIVEFLGEL